MKKIAFLRSIEIQQTVPHLDELGAALRADGLVAKLFYTDGECGPGDFRGEAEKLAGDVSCDEVVRRVLDWGADGVISLSIPDENALRDALVCARLAEAGLATVMHSVDSTSVMANKWDTKGVVGEHGLRTPPGMLVDGDLLNNRTVSVPAYVDYLHGRTAEIGYPLLSKPLWDCLANGIELIEDAAGLTAYLSKPYDGNVVLEKCLSGELCSVEVVGTGGDYDVLPLIWKGPTGGAPTFVFTTMRYSAPRRTADVEFEPVAGRLQELCTTLGINGSVEVEMIYADGEYHVIEINPRVSGSTTLSIAASGANTYVGLLDILRGRWTTSARAGERRIAMQIPTTALTAAASAAARGALDVLRAGSFTVSGVRYANMVITCGLDEADRLTCALETLCAEHDFVDPIVLTEIKRVLAGIDTVAFSLAG